jgi:serine/threonine-protein kinase
MPERLGHYVIRAKIGEGGMAVVYLGHQAREAGERIAAVKVIKDEYSLNTDFVAMFMDEAKIVSRLDHPNIVKVYELGHEGNRLFIAMELLFGQSLWSIWNACRTRGMRLRYDLVAWIGARVCEGLHHAHDLRGEDGRPTDLVHRDMNASNIFVTYDGAVKIIDFGLAKAIGRVSKTAAGVVKGKLAYMSPEQTVGRPLDRRSDVFALGVTLWEVTADRRLFKGADDLETLKRVYAGVVPDPTALVEAYPPALWRILRRALAREVNERYPTALALGRELDSFALSEGRSVERETVADVMRALFAGERERQAHWVDEASRPDRPAPREQMMPGPAPGVRSDTAAPPAMPAEPIDEQLFSGPVMTVRDPFMAERQAATAQGGFTTGEMARLRETAGVPPTPDAPFRPSRNTPGMITGSGSGPSPRPPSTAVATVVTLFAAALVVAALVAAALLMNRH